MAYTGQTVGIPFGEGGLQTDDPNTRILPTRLISAENVWLDRGLAEKEGGSRRWNSTELPDAVKQFHDYWPTQTKQRVIAICGNGKVYRLPTRYAYAEVTAAGSAPATLSVANYLKMVEGGQEETGNSKKLFLLNGHNPIQVITADGTTRANISAGAADWTGTNQPFSAIVFRGAMYAFGNSNSPHRVYKSLETDHEDFTTTPRSYEVYPGDGEKLICAFVFRKKLFMLKYPKGLYVLEDSAADDADWFFDKATVNIGGISPHCVCAAIDDALIANAYGSVTSLQAANVYGDLLSADLFHAHRVQKYVEDNLRADGQNNRQAVYFEGRKRAMFTFQSFTSPVNDQICNVAFKSSEVQQITWTTKDQPNCLVIKRDDNGLERPAYGADDGFIYEMEQADRWVGDEAGTETGYTMEVQIPHVDFGPLGPTISEASKNFDFLDVVYVPTGKWNLSTDVFIDGKFHKTIDCDLSCGEELDAPPTNEVSTVDPTVERSKRFDVGGSGKRISFRCYNSGTGENVKAVGLKLSFRIAGSKETPGKG